MQPNEKEKTKVPPKPGRKAKLEEIGRLVVDALITGVENPLDGLSEILEVDGSVDDALVLVRAHLRMRVKAAMKVEGLPPAEAAVDVEARSLRAFGQGAP